MKGENVITEICRWSVDRSRTARNVFPLFYLCSSVFICGQFLSPAAALAEDVVVLKPSGNSRTQRRVVGEITDYNGREIIIRTASGRETSLPADRVEEISTEYTEPHIDADALFAQRKFKEAFAKYKAALATEKRFWVQRQILASIAWCQRARGKAVDAAQAFLLIVKHDPDTPFYDAIPLVWRPGELPLEVQRKATEYLRDETNSVAQLIGASWLLSDTAQRSAAIAKLESLTESGEKRVAQLADAQLWRTQLVSAGSGEVHRWQSAIDRMPESLHGGPYYLLGQLLAKEKRYDDAALALLRPAILHAQDRSLASESLLAAGEALAAAGDKSQAAICWQELVRDYDDLPAAAAAKNLLAREKQGG